MFCRNFSVEFYGHGIHEDPIMANKQNIYESKILQYVSWKCSAWTCPSRKLLTEWSSVFRQKIRSIYNCRIELWEEWSDQIVCFHSFKLGSAEERDTPEKPLGEMLFCVPRGDGGPKRALTERDVWFTRLTILPQNKSTSLTETSITSCSIHRDKKHPVSLQNVTEKTYKSNLSRFWNDCFVSWLTLMELRVSQCMCMLQSVSAFVQVKVTHDRLIDSLQQPE